MELQNHWSFVAECLETNDFLALHAMPEGLNLAQLELTQLDQAREMLELQRHLTVRLEEAGVSIQRELDFLHTLEGSAKVSDALFIDESL